MYITEEEKLMYRVMKAIYDSGIPMDFKGAMVLKACLLEAGFQEEIRHTIDIDANWYSESEPTPEQMTDSITEALRRSHINLNVVLYRPYGRGRSAGFDFKDPETGDNLFSLDVDVNYQCLKARVIHPIQKERIVRTTFERFLFYSDFFPRSYFHRNLPCSPDRGSEVPDFSRISHDEYVLTW